ncbi:MAG TPA: molybdopterin-dependent oxidoreductase [Candidatus Angelobacter sp.]|nr:molybdopterin-dependent oxidoreductase [Candidatus Angelobacter sp.]
MHPLDFPLWLRALHFCNLLFITLLIRSGLEILAAHPKLYWNDNCVPGTEWIRFDKGIPDARRIAPTPHFGQVSALAPLGGSRSALGTLAAALLTVLYLFLLMFVVPARQPQQELLWTSRDEEISLPSWLALPGRKNLGIARHWHFLCDGGWLLTGIAYYTLLFGTGEWRRLVPQSWSVIPGAWHALVQYATFHLVETPGGYNPLQQLAYFFAVFILAPLAILTGVAMSPSITARFPWYLKLFRGRQPARSIHFLCMVAFCLFIIVHVAMVIAHGFGRELGKIVLGQTTHPDVSLALWIGCAGLLGVVVIHILATQASLRHPRFVQDWIGFMIDGARRGLFGHSISRQHYPASEIAPYFRVNGRPPVDQRYTSLARDGFAGYELEIGGLVENPLRFTLAELQHMPRHVQVTKHCCIQGWSAVAEWGGVELGRIIHLCRPLPQARFIAFYAFDNKSQTEPEPDGPGDFYGTINMDLARDHQTILAYEMNGEPLPVAHGAPLRLRVETQLGFMMVKYIRRIEFIADYRSLGHGEGGWREDYQFYSPEAGI